MKEIAASGDDAADVRTRLLDATERLIATEGIEKLTIRDVNTSAGSSPAATHYYFGSIFELVNAAIARRGDTTQQRRLAMFAPLLDDPRPDLWAVTQAFALPVIELDRTEEGHNWLGMLARLFISGRDWRELAARVFIHRSQDIHATLRRAIPGATDQMVQGRRNAATALLLSPAVRLDFRVNEIPRPTRDERERSQLHHIHAVFSAPTDERPISPTVGR